MNEYPLFRDRKEAGQQLAAHLRQYRNDPDAIVLGLPRGGVPVAYEVAQKLHLPLDVFLVRKLGAPFQEELAMGAIASGGVIYLNENVISDLGITQEDINEVIAEEESVLASRESRYRADRPFPNLMGKKVILVDDGIATGATVKVAIKALKKSSPAKIIVAVPVAPKSTVPEIVPLVDEVVCPNPVSIFYGVGMFYENFSQTTDEEVCCLLALRNSAL